MSGLTCAILLGRTPGLPQRPIARRFVGSVGCSRVGTPAAVAVGPSGWTTDGLLSRFIKLLQQVWLSPFGDALTQRACHVFNDATTEPKYWFLQGSVPSDAAVPLPQRPRIGRSVGHRRNPDALSR